MATPERREARPLTIAVPKGRVLGALARALGAAGLPEGDLLADDRRLVRTIGPYRFLLLKPDDVPTYVEWGAADLGVVGRDVLIEREYDLYAPLDLGIGRCRLIVAGLAGTPVGPEPLRVATKFQNVAARHFASRGVPADVVFVQSSVELAPLLGLADVIVDLVESGETLKQNGLVELEHIADISTLVVANRSAYKLKRALIAPLLDRLAQPRLAQSRA